MLMIAPLPSTLIMFVHLRGHDRLEHYFDLWNSQECANDGVIRRADTDNTDEASRPAN